MPPLDDDPPAEPSAPEPSRGRSATLAIAFLATGAAVLLHILTRVSLRLGVAAALLVILAALLVVLRHADPVTQSHLRTRLRIGVFSGLVATATYDASRWALSQLDPSPYLPFEAIKAFGRLLAGVDASPLAVWLSGFALHAMNGIAFGVAFAIVLGGRGILVGVAWGLFLEIFQVTLYPGWLNVAAYKEFVTISGLGHIVYGATLAWMVRALLNRSGPSRS